MQHALQVEAHSALAAAWSVGQGFYVQHHSDTVWTRSEL